MEQAGWEVSHLLHASPTVEWPDMPERVDAVRVLESHREDSLHGHGDRVLEDWLAVGVGGDFVEDEVSIQN